MGSQRSKQTFILFTYGEMGARAIFEIDAEYYVLQEDYDELEEENKKLKSDLAETQKIGESWRQECKRLLGLQLCGKTIAERIEYDKKVFRE